MSLKLAIANDIAHRYNDYDGFVILHGTDTMAYTASALSFMLQGINKPVIVTGSQIPLSEIRNDAQDNLVTAMLRFIVCVFTTFRHTFRNFTCKLITI